MATRDEVVEWLKANGWRYTAGAEHFDMDVAVVRKWGRTARGLPVGVPKPMSDSKPKAEKTPAASRDAQARVDARDPDNADLIEPANMSRLERLEWQLKKALTVLARIEHMPHGARAVNGVMLTIRQLGEDLDEERKRVAANDALSADLTADEAAEALIAVLADMPAETRARVREALAEPELRVVDGAS